MKPDSSLAFNNGNSGTLQVSLELWVSVIEHTECTDFLRFCGQVLSGSHVQSQQCKVLAQIVLCTPEACRLWLNGTHQPEWRKMFAVFTATRAQFDSDNAMRAAFMGPQK